MQRSSWGRDREQHLPPELVGAASQQTGPGGKHLKDLWLDIAVAVCPVLVSQFSTEDFADGRARKVAKFDGFRRLY